MSYDIAAINAEYDDARATAAAASSAPILLPAYTGSATDLQYLHDYVVQAASTFYGVDPHVFDTATVYSTSLLRDFVHRAIYYNDAAPADGVTDAPSTFASDVGSMFRAPGFASCGLAAWQMFTVFEAFGYQTTRIDTISAEYSQLGTDPNGYDNSHVTTEVYIPELGQSIVQDATFNLIAEDSSGAMLNYQQIRAAVAAGGAVSDHAFTSYTYDYIGADYTGSVPASEWDWILDDFKVPYSWVQQGQSLQGSALQGMFQFSAYLHSQPQVGAYTTSAAAVSQLQGEGVDYTSWTTDAAKITGWIKAADDIAGTPGASHYVSGFAVLADDGSIQSEWLTVSIADASFISFDLLSRTVLNGSFDQLQAEAMGVGPDLNPGADLSWAFNPFVLMEANGTLRASWDSNFVFSTPHLDYSTSPAGMTIDLQNNSALNQATGRADPVGQVQSVVGSAYADWIYVPIASLSSETIAMGAGTDVLFVQGSGVVDLSHVQQVENVYLDNVGFNTLTVTDAADAGQMVLHGGSRGNRIDASGVASSGSLYYYAGAGGGDTYLGGAAISTIYVSLASLPLDTFTLGSGYETIVVQQAGTVRLTGVTGSLEALYLANGGSNAVVIPNAIVGSSIAIHPGTSTETVDARTVAAGKALWFYGGAENDTLYLLASAVGGDHLAFGGGTNTLMLSGAGTVNLTGATGTLSSLYLGDGGDSVALLNALASASTIVHGGSGADVLDASALAAGKKVAFYAGAGDSFTGGAETNTIYAATSALATISLHFGAGYDAIVLNGAGAVDLSHVTGAISALYLGNGGANTLTLSDANAGSALVIYGGDGADTIDASSVASGKLITYYASAGDHITGGAGNDVVYAQTSSLGSDQFDFGAGSNTLSLTGAGTVDLSHVSGTLSTLNLGSGAGGNHLTLPAALGASTLIIHAGASGDTIDFSASLSGKTAYFYSGAGGDAFTGGAANETFYTGGGDAYTGGGGHDSFVFMNTGAVTISDFDPAQDRFVFSDAAFNLGINEGQGTSSSHALDAGVFSPATDGTFTAATQRFAYDQSTGSLYYDADGDPSHAVLIATLTNHAALNSHDLFFFH